MIDIKVYNVTLILTNCYLLTDKETGEMAVVDPGDRSDKLIEYVNSTGDKIKYVFLTHGHFDHIGYAKQLADMYGAKIVCSVEADKYLSDNKLNLSYRHDEVENISPFKADILLKDGDTIRLGNTEIKFITTPGHTDGCGCYIFDDVIISGDTLFCESYGRTDFETSSFTDMMASLKKLKEIKGDYQVLPGHGLTTTLEHERKYNPLMSRI
jgi:glyoxylase-like metal-dependent hydrolase (beta-lactamase superfamily II)